MSTVINTETTEPASLRKQIDRKPSVVVRAAIHGLQTNKDRNDFRLDMGTYGGVGYRGEKVVCIGCMATVAMQSISNVVFTSSTIHNHHQHANACGSSAIDVAIFEIAVNDLRLNTTTELYRICNLDTHEQATLPTTVPAIDPSETPFGLTDNLNGILLIGRPSDGQVAVAIARLTKLAVILENKGF